VEQLLPVWAHPHTSWRLAENDWPRPQFTFGLALPEVFRLGSAAGVRAVGSYWGYEWLTGLSAGVHQETNTPLPPNELERFLAERHGVTGPNEVNAVYALGQPPAGLPPDEVLEQFATNHGRAIRDWARNAFNGIEARLGGWAKARQAVESGHQWAAERRLKLTAMPTRLVSVNSIDGHLHWARGYATLYERVALELEDLTVRRPRPRICPLCERPFIPLRSSQRVCANSLWDENTRRPFQRCTFGSDPATFDEAAARLYKTARKTQWARMNRVRNAHGANDPRTHKAIRDWEQWLKDNGAPRPRGGPRRSDASDAPFTPTSVSDADRPAD
jgi:hypothetical protein